jgi:hypothetical protein
VSDREDLPLFSPPPPHLCCSVALSALVLGFSIAAAAEPAADKPDLEIRGKFKAKEMRFEHVPEVNVTFSGTPGRQDVWTSSRKNFPKPVRAGETYRDVEGEVEISTKLPRGEKPPAGADRQAPGRK